MEVLLNEMASEGWSYVRAETLPSNDRSGMTRRVVETYQNVLVFSKLVDAAEAVAPAPVVAPVIAPVAPLPVEPAVSAPEEVAEVVEDVVEEDTSAETRA
jgi:hypothetical protein